jgi:hypothetical protein
MMAGKGKDSRWQTAKGYGDKAASAAAKFPGQVAGRRAHHHLLLTMYLLFVLVVVLRAAADYVPAAGGTAKGSSPPGGGQLAPLPLFAGGTGLFFLLSFPASRGGGAAALANGFGALVILALVMRSGRELQTVAGWYKAIAGNGTSTKETT